MKGMMCFSVYVLVDFLKMTNLCQFRRDDIWMLRGCDCLVSFVSV